MKQPNLILTMLFMLCLAQNVRADQQVDKDTTTGEEVIDNDVQENANIKKIHDLLKELVSAKALELNENGNIQVKQSIFEKLRNQGRLMATPARAGGLCD